MCEEEMGVGLILVIDEEKRLMYPMVISLFCGGK